LGCKRLILLGLVLLLGTCLRETSPPAARAYITYPVQTLGTLCNSTYITLVRVEKVSQEKGIIVYRKIRDLKGKYPQETIRHVFDLKNTPRHNGSGDVPIRPDETDWKYAMSWAEPGKTAVVFALKYDPYGDFGHTYIDGLWYATMCPKRDWDLWYSIYSDPALLSRWHCGTPARLTSAVETMLAGKIAVVPSLVEGTRDDLRRGKGKIQGLKVGTQLQDYNPGRDRVANWVDKDAVPSLIKALENTDRQVRLQAVKELGLIGPEGKTAVGKLIPLVQDKDDETRLAALNSLALIGPEAKVTQPAYLTALADKNAQVRVAAARAVGKLGVQAREAAPLLTKLLQTEGGDRLDFAESLGRVDPENQAVVPVLVPLLKHPTAERRLQAAEILAQTPARAKAAGPALLDLLKEPNAAYRLRVIEILAPTGVGSAEIGAAVTALFDDPAREGRLRACAVLAQLGPAAKPAVPGLIKAMKDADRDVRAQAAEALGMIGPDAKEAIPVLAEAVRNEASGTVRMRSADALGKLGPDAKSALPALQAGLSDPRMAQRPEVLAKIKEALVKLK
jgi:HEAT repeat protein